MMCKIMDVLCTEEETDEKVDEIEAVRGVICSLETDKILYDTTE